MKGLVTGASGFLGGAVADAARAAGWSIAAVGRQELRDVATWTDCVRISAPDVVLHFAGSASVGDSLVNPDADFSASTALTQRVLEGARQSGRRPAIVLASSAAVYGSPEALPISESAPLRPESPYGFHKVLSESLGREYADCFGMNVSVFRYFSLFGPRQRRLLAWEIFDQLRRGDVTLRGTGYEERDYLGGAEAAATTIALAKVFRETEPAFRILNLASGTAISVRTLAENLRELIRPSAAIHFAGQTLAGNPSRWAADITRLQTILPGWQPSPLRAALESCIHEWLAEHPLIP